MVISNTKFRNLLNVTVSTLLASGLLVGTSASAAEWVSASAPITYKGSNPYTTGYMQAPAPQAQIPQYRPQAALPQVMAPVPQMNTNPGQFAPNTVDPTLYKHQKVGKPYTVAGQTYYPRHDPSYDRVGTASWYGDKFHGKPTANGELYNKHAMTAAHPTLPLNSYVIVTNMQTGQALKVRLNDRGPFIDNRMIDLSEAAATALGIRHGGLAQVRVQYAGPAAPTANNRTFQPKAPQMAQRPVIQVPQIAAPVYQQPSAPVAQPQAPLYQPLRQQVQPPAKTAQLPRTPLPFPSTPQFTMPDVMESAPVGLDLELPAVPRSIPKASKTQNGQSDDSVVTLTIKGPIHMANSRNTHPGAQFIPAVNRVTYKTVK